MNHNDEMLARLVSQLAEDGADLVTVRALIEEASDAGAGRAMARLGLADPHARKDLDELRQLLAAWRDAKRSALRTAFDWFAKALLALLLFGLAVRFGFRGWLGQ